MPGGLGWLPFALGAAGWLGLLLVEGARGARALGHRAADPPLPGAAGLGRAGRRIGGTALGVAVLVPALVPGLDGRLLDGGEGGGGGSGTSRSVNTYNPITRLRGELTLPNPVDVLRYTTDDPSPDYLRMTTLGVYDGDGWRQQVLNGNVRDNGVDGPLPAPVGRAPGAPGAARAGHHRRPVARRLLAAGTVDARAGRRRGPVDVGPGQRERLRDPVRHHRGRPVHRHRRPARAPSPTTSTPRRRASRRRSCRTPARRGHAGRASITESVTAGAETDYDKAVALQAFFRSPSSGFRYEEQTESGGSPDALQAFLEQRVGFCEQYASAMAAMLRLAGVPSRVAVGFTPGQQQSDGSYVVTTDEAHAWPEAWFEGFGWVRFEPTPVAERHPPAVVRQPACPAGPGADRRAGRQRHARRRRPPAARARPTASAWPTRSARTRP